MSIHPTHRILTAGLHWVAAGDVRVGDEVVGFDTEGGRNGRRYRRATVTRVAAARVPACAVTLSSGETLTVATTTHWLTGSQGGVTTHWALPASFRAHERLTYNTTKVARIFAVWDREQTYTAGWLAGILDGEGSLDVTHRVTVVQRPGLTLDSIVRGFTERGTAIAVAPLSAPASANALGRNDCMAVRLQGPLHERLALLGTLRPERLIGKVEPERFGRMDRRHQTHAVLAVRPLGEQDVVAITTTTNTLFVEGYPLRGDTLC